MDTYGKAMSTTSVGVLGTLDKNYAGTYSPSTTGFAESRSFYRDGGAAPYNAHFTVALQGKKTSDQMSHFHISLEFGGGGGSQNVGVYFNYNAAKGNLAATVNSTGKTSSTMDAFHDAFEKKECWFSVYQMAVQFFNKVAKPASPVTAVYDVEYKELVNATSETISV